MHFQGGRGWHLGAAGQDLYEDKCDVISGDRADALHRLQLSSAGGQQAGYQSAVQGVLLHSHAA